MEMEAKSPNWHLPDRRTGEQLCRTGKILSGQTGKRSGDRKGVDGKMHPVSQGAGLPEALPGEYAPLF